MGPKAHTWWIYIDYNLVEDTVVNICMLLATSEYSIITIYSLLEDDECRRVGEAICSNTQNIQKNNLEITLYPF